LDGFRNSNAYAIRGHRKIFSSTKHQSQQNQYVSAWPRRSDIAPHYEVCQPRYTGSVDCAVREAMERLRPKHGSAPRSPAAHCALARASERLYRNCYASMSRGSLCHSVRNATRPPARLDQGSSGFPGVIDGCRCACPRIVSLAHRVRGLLGM
jgi:hypothetical protein